MKRTEQNDATKNGVFPQILFLMGKMMMNHWERGTPGYQFSDKTMGAGLLRVAGIATTILGVRILPGLWSDGPTYGFCPPF